MRCACPRTGMAGSSRGIGCRRSVFGLQTVTTGNAYGVTDTEGGSNLPLPMLMRSSLFVLALVLWGLDPSQGQDVHPAPDVIVLYAFDGTDAARWGVVNDGVMGGRSRGYGSIDAERMRFSGELVTRGGGFTSVRTPAALDLSAYDGLELRVRGNGRTFEVELSDGARFRGRTVSRRAAFETETDWTTVRVPFEAFRSSIFGQRVDAGPLNTSRIRAVGLYILDGVDGPFELEVEEIRAYRDQRI
jgi:NADH dehydrogenase [ubiquinone] 1 alpha subcomplex assembly factor 1